MFGVPFEHPMEIAPETTVEITDRAELNLVVRLNAMQNWDDANASWRRCDPEIEDVLELATVPGTTKVEWLGRTWYDLHPLPDAESFGGFPRMLVSPEGDGYVTIVDC